MTKQEKKRINELIRSLESFAQYQWDHAKEKSEPERYEGFAQGIQHAIGCLEEFRTDDKDESSRVEEIEKPIKPDNNSGIGSTTNHRKFPTQKNKIAFTNKRNSLLPLSFHLFYYDVRIGEGYNFRLIRKMAITTSSNLRWRNFRTSIGCWKLRKDKQESTRP